jgi:hypothetical protein
MTIYYTVIRMTWGTFRIAEPRNFFRLGVSFQKCKDSPVCHLSSSGTMHTFQPLARQKHGRKSVSCRLFLLFQALILLELNGLRYLGF